MSLSFEIPDPTIEVEPGQAQSVEKLFNDYVLGKLDPRQIGGGTFDSEEGKVTEDVDPFNSFGMTLEQADELRRRSEETIRGEKRNRKDVANASNDTKQQASQKSDAPKDDKPGVSEPGAKD